MKYGSRAYPAECLSWCYVPEDVGRNAMTEKLRHRDRELERDKHASGEPATFAAWAVEHLAGYAHLPMIQAQVAERRLQLESEQRRLEERFACAFTELEVAAAKLDDQLRLLDQLEAGA